MLWREERNGFYVKPWRMAGYSGWRCGRVEYGMRQDGGCVRLSSGLAASYWWDLWQVTHRCSRIDLQATLRCDGPVNDELLFMKQAVETCFMNKENGPRITWWSSSDGGATLYLGARQSSFYFRAYNKAVQSGLDEWSNCLRVELEVKNKLCESAIAYMLIQETVQAGVLYLLQQYMSNRGILTNFVDANPRSLYERPTIVTDRLNSLEWLRSAVKPTVQRLLDAGLVQEVLDSLGVHYPPKEELP